MEMEPASGPEVLLTQESQRMKHRKKRKSLLFALFGILILGGLVFVGVYYQNQIRTNLSLISNKLDINTLLASLKMKPRVVTPKIISQGKLSDLATKDQPSLFYADLEYNPKKGIVTQLKVGRGGTLPEYLQEMPQVSATKFIYRVSLVSAGKELILNGWLSDDISSIQSPKGTLKFRVQTFYYPNALVRVYTKDNKLIWIGKVT